MKKSLILLLAFSLFVTCFAGCSKEEETTQAAAETTAEPQTSTEEPTAATQADIEDLVGAVEEKDSERTKKNLPLALAGLGCVAVLFIGAIWWDRRRR